MINLRIDVFLISTIQNALSVQRIMQRFEIYGGNKMNGQSDKIYSGHILGTQMINSVLWPTGLARES